MSNEWTPFQNAQDIKRVERRLELLERETDRRFAEAARHRSDHGHKLASLETAVNLLSAKTPPPLPPEFPMWLRITLPLLAAAAVGFALLWIGAIQ